MAFTPQNTFGNFNGTTEVTLLVAPSSGRRHPGSFIIYNRDTGQVTVTISLKSSGTLYPLYKVTLDVDDSFVLEQGDLPSLDATTESLVAVLSAAPATTQPTFAGSFADRT